MAHPPKQVFHDLISVVNGMYDMCECELYENVNLAMYIIGWLEQLNLIPDRDNG